MVRIDRLREDSEKRILRCSEGNSIWYQIWIDPGDMMRIESLLEGGDRLWCIEIQKYYVLFSGFLCVVSWYALNVCRKKF